MRYNRDDIGDEIIFDRDTSAPKNKMKNYQRFRRLQQQKETSNTTDKKKVNTNKPSENKKEVKPLLLNN